MGNQKNKQTKETMNKQPNHAELDQPQPREAFGHPVTTGAKYHVSNHRPGHDTSPAPAQETYASGEHPQQAVSLPHNGAKVPTTPLSERIRQGLAREEKH